VWDRAVDGRILRFHLGGLNHQNFLMYDDETGSWWQQITGEAILGPLKGKRLRRINSDEVTLAIWRAEHPASSAVRFDPRYLSQYPASDWERRVANVPPPPGTPAGPADPRELIVGVDLDGEAAAWPLATLRERSPVNAKLGRTPILLVVAPDGGSVRCFVRPSGAEFYRRVEDGALIDGTTGSSWSFAGKATAGPLTGKSLEPVQTTKDFWFDWQRYHPQGSLRRSGN
jgi:hypothetical protein